MVSLLARLPWPRGGDEHAPHRVRSGWLALGATAAVTVSGMLVLALAVVVVQTLDPSGGLPVSGSLALAVRLWLLAQGGQLQLASGPIVLAPLAITAAIAWGLSRVGRLLGRADELRAGRAFSTALAGHVVLTLALALAVSSSGARIGLVRTLLGAAVLGAVALGWGLGRDSGLLDAALDRLPTATRPMLRGVVAGMLAALALCGIVVAVALGADAHGYAVVSGSLGGAGAGAVGLLGLGAILLPNAAAAVLGLAAGPGFFVGTGTLISVHGITLSPVPALPLLAALPDTQAVPLLAFVSQAVPVVAGLVAGTTVGRWFTDVDGGSIVAGLTGIGAGVLMGVLSAGLAWIGGGSLGNGALAHVGAPPLTTGLAVAAQCGIAAAVAGATTRWRASR
ncbi:MAG: hypothetical protein QOE37_2239 [Microbacteriaceae bacterium]|nr:hypothetical protein [Microbacteriaceae bacterium]